MVFCLENEFVFDLSILLKHNGKQIKKWGKIFLAPAPAESTFPNPAVELALLATLSSNLTASLIETSQTHLQLPHLNTTDIFFRIALYEVSHIQNPLFEILQQSKPFL